MYLNYVFELFYFILNIQTTKMKLNCLDVNDDEVYANHICINNIHKVELDDWRYLRYGFYREENMLFTLFNG